MRTHLLLLPFVALSFTAQAQFEIGGKAGLNYHFQNVGRGESAPDNFTLPEGDSGLGFHFGGFLKIGLSDNVYVRPELLYSTRTSVRTTSSSLTILGISTDVEREDRSTLQYLEVPVLLGFHLSRNLSLQAGPGFGVLSGNKVKTTGTQRVTAGGQTVTNSLDGTSNSTEGLRSVELAGVLGLGYHADNGLDIGIRYWRGLNTLNENTDLVKVNQNVVQFSVGFAFLRN